MKIAFAVVAAGLALAALPANAEETRIGLGVGPVGAGVTVGSDRGHDRTTVIRREEEPRDKTVIIKKDRDAPVVEEKTIIHDHD